MKELGYSQVKSAPFPKIIESMNSPKYSHGLAIAWPCLDRHGHEDCT